MASTQIQQVFDKAVQHHQAGRLRQATELYRQILAEDPQQTLVMHNLGAICYQMGRHDEAAELMRRVIAANPNVVEAHDLLGCALEGQGRLSEAIAAHRAAITLHPDFAEAHSNLGNALSSQGDFDGAVSAYRQALALNPNFFRAQNNLSVALRSKGELDQSIAAARAAIALEPRFAEAHNNLGIALKDKGRFDESIAAYRRAIKLNASYAEAHNNLGLALKDIGELDEAIAELREGLRLQPNYPQDHSNLILTMHYHPDSDARAIAGECRRWNTQHAQPLRKLIQPHSNRRDPNRKLRIGYLSPDLRAHPVGRFLLPLLAHRDKSQVEAFSYANVPVPDAMTEQLRSHTDQWRTVFGISDSNLAELIRRDQIDILVDLSMHTANNRLLVFARKPAPVQVSYLAYCSTTGLDTIEYRLSDPHLDPPGTDESIYCEKTIRLPRTYWCYDGVFNPPHFSDLPALSRGTITFGCLNNFCKVSKSVLDTWTRILRDVPDSHFLLSAPEGSHRQRILDLLNRQGVASARVQFVARQRPGEYFRLYDQIDIALDTFPFCGGTTTCDALWMGVPAVILAGKTAVGRAGVSILSNVGLPELIADSQQDYARLAVELAGDLPRLKELRGTLRHRLQDSPLADGPGFARDVEAAYRQMWRAWCATEPTRG